MTISHRSTSMAFLSSPVTMLVLSSSSISTRKVHSSMNGGFKTGCGKTSDDSLENWELDEVDESLDEEGCRIDCLFC